MANTGKREKGKRHKKAFQPHGNGITFAPFPDPTSAMGRVMAKDGTRFRAYPYLQSFVRPLVPNEFDGRQVVSPERMNECTHIFVTRIDPTSVARTRKPILTEQAEMYQAFSVLDQADLRIDSSQGKSTGPFSLPEETQHLTLTATTIGI